MDAISEPLMEDIWFEHRSFRRCLAELAVSRLSDRDGLTILTGVEGVGKTALFSRILAEPEASEGCILLLGDREMTFSRFLKLCAEGFGLPSEFENPDGHLRILSSVMVERSRSGRESVVFIDRAERLSRRFLQELSEFSSWHRAGHKLCQVVLAIRQDNKGRLPPRYEGIEAAWYFELQPVGERDLVEFLCWALSRRGIPPGVAEALCANSEVQEAIFDETGGLPGLLDELAGRLSKGPLSRGEELTHEAFMAAFSTGPCNGDPPDSPTQGPASTSRETATSEIVKGKRSRSRDLDGVALIAVPEAELGTGAMAFAKIAFSRIARARRAIWYWMVGLVGLSAASVSALYLHPGYFAGTTALSGSGLAQDLEAANSTIKSDSLLEPGPAMDLSQARYPYLVAPRRNEPSMPSQDAVSEYQAESLNMEWTSMNVGAALVQVVMPTSPTQLSLEAALGEEDRKFPLFSNTDYVMKDRSQEVTFSLAGLPAGARLSGAVKLEDGLWHFQYKDMGDIKLLAPQNYSGSFELAVMATSRNAEGQLTHSAGVLPVVIAGQADAPRLLVEPARGIEGEALRLNFAVEALDQDGSEQVELEVANLPEGSVLSAGRPNEEGRWRLQPEDLEGLRLRLPNSFVGHLQLDVTATSIDGSDRAQIAKSVSVEVLPRLSDERIAEIVRRGNELMDLRDVKGARAQYEAAALRGDASAMTALGNTYDPLVFKARDLSADGADPELARHWYLRSIAAGDATAVKRLEELSDRYGTELR